MSRFFIKLPGLNSLALYFVPVPVSGQISLLPAEGTGETGIAGIAGIAGKLVPRWSSR
jgi:hypothetical protein